MISLSLSLFHLLLNTISFSLTFSPPSLFQSSSFFPSFYKNRRQFSTEFFAFMSSLSVTKSGGGGGGSGCRWLRFEYENCLCRQRAILKIVVDPRNESNGMLYFVCEQKGKVGGCKYFRWCHPKSVDFEGCNYLLVDGRREDEVGREDEVDSEVSPNRVEGGSKAKDCILVLFVGISLLVSFVAILVSLMK